MDTVFCTTLLHNFVSWLLHTISHNFLPGPICPDNFYQLIIPEYLNWIMPFYSIIHSKDSKGFTYGQQSLRVITSQRPSSNQTNMWQGLDRENSKENLRLKDLDKKNSYENFRLRDFEKFCDGFWLDLGGRGRIWPIPEAGHLFGITAGRFALWFPCLRPTLHGGQTWSLVPDSWVGAMGW